MKRCKVCWKKPRLERRVNNEGILFCSDDCYEEFEGSEYYFDHPYIDDYEMIRLGYMEWMQTYEDDLYKNLMFGYPKKEELVDDIEEYMDGFFDCYLLEGHDGVFSLEICRYLLAFEELTDIIRKWEANERELKKRWEAYREQRRLEKEEEELEEIWG